MNELPSSLIEKEIGSPSCPVEKRWTIDVREHSLIHLLGNNDKKDDPSPTAQPSIPGFPWKSERLEWGDLHLCEYTTAMSSHDNASSSFPPPQITTRRLLIVERKTWSDWISSQTDGRYRDQRTRLLSQPCPFVYLLEGVPSLSFSLPTTQRHSPHSSFLLRTKNPAVGRQKSFLSSQERDAYWMLQRLILYYGVRVVFTTGPQETVEWMSVIWKRWNQNAVTSHGQTTLVSSSSLSAVVEEAEDTTSISSDHQQHIMKRAMMYPLSRRSLETPQDHLVALLSTMEGISWDSALLFCQLHRFVSVVDFISRWTTVDAFQQLPLRENGKRKIGPRVAMRIRDQFGFSS